MTLGISDGVNLWAIRYASAETPRTLFHSKEMRALKELSPQVADFSDDTRVIVSEPFGQLSEAWCEISPSTVVVINGDHLETQPFQPRA